MERTAQSVPDVRAKSRVQALRNPVIPPSQTWKCEECHFVLGYSNSDKTELRMKFKDQYITIVKAERVSCACRRCAKWNSVGAQAE